MLDRKRLRKKVLLSLMSSPWTLVPFLGGATALAAGWAMGMGHGLTLFSGLTGILSGAGMFLTQLLVGGDKAARKALDELQREAQQTAQRRLDDLDRRLLADEDPRTEQALRDLRTLVEAFREGDHWSDNLNAASAFDILSTVDDLFSACERSLEQTLELWETAQDVSVAEARKALLDRRERIIAEVQASIVQLGQILAGIQSLHGERASTVELSRLRRELEQSLAVARRVDEKMKAWRADGAELE